MTRSWAGVLRIFAATSSAVGGVPDLLHRGEYGRLVPPNDPDAFAAAVIAALAEPERHTARQDIVAAYDITRLAADLASLYRSLLE